VRLCGEIDLSAAGEVRRELGQHVDDEGDVIVDAGEVSFIDVGGCRAIVETAAQLSGDRRLVLRDAPPQLVRVLAICGWDHDPHLTVIPRGAAA
jgi:anti-anti-sigma factor